MTAPRWRSRTPWTHPRPCGPAVAGTPAPPWRLYVRPAVRRRGENGRIPSDPPLLRQKRLTEGTGLARLFSRDGWPDSSPRRPRPAWERKTVSHTGYLVCVFDFVDLFAGVGGFHSALSGLGGRAVLAAEIDPNAARVYERAWGLRPERDVRELSASGSTRIPDHDVLTAGFPCQPFSKSGRQLGMSEDRGTLFEDVLTIIRDKKPTVVMLENVRNIAGPRQRATWEAVIGGLRQLGYAVSSQPLIFSPHLLSPEHGGAPQIRERVYILGRHAGSEEALESDPSIPLANAPQHGWDPGRWDLSRHALLPEPTGIGRQRYALTAEEQSWIETWNRLLAALGGRRLPGHPLWEEAWTRRIPSTNGLPEWKIGFLEKNRRFYVDNRDVIDAWRRDNPQIAQFPRSRRKFEWQAQDAPRDLWRLLIHLRPSGIRVKKPTYAPALVAINQASIYGPARRRLTPLEAARLQGFPQDFAFGDQVDALSYKQMGNAVNVGTAAYVFATYVRENAEALSAESTRGAAIVSAVLAASFPPISDLRGEEPLEAKRA
jgi:DNA (cytosine-5)-methyltransferase 1